jgi:DUF4097 and DUF4098 domain-containing protein YvlB
VLVTTGLIATGAQRVHWNELNNEWGMNGSWFGDMFGQEYTFSQQLQQDFPAGATLRVSSDRGSINIHSWNQNRIQVAVAKKLRATDEVDAKRVDASTQAQLNVNGNQYMLNANTRGAGERPVESDLDIYIPANAAVDLATRGDEVNVRDRVGNVQVSNSGGNVTLENLQGDAILRVRHGDVRIAKVSGDVSVDGEVNQVDISNVNSVRLSGGATDGIRLAHIAKSVEYQSSRTRLKSGRLDGELALEGSDSSGSQLNGPLRLTTRSKDIRLKDVSGPVEVENTNGDVEVQVSKLPLGAVQISNRKGDVRVTLPAKSAFQLEARTRNGDISSDYSLNQHKDRREATATGTVGSGGPKIEINSEFGDVEIKKAG